MNIALDYDQTYSAAPNMFQMLIETFKCFGHKVYIVTARNPKLDEIKINFGRNVEVVYCDGVAKRHVMTNQRGIKIDVWIDDKPESVDNNSPAPYEALQKWRETRVEAWDDKPQVIKPPILKGRPLSQIGIYGHKSPEQIKSEFEKVFELMRSNG